MNAQRKLQQRWDDMLPEEDEVHEVAVNRWVEDGAEQLVLGSDVLFTLKYGHWEGVHYSQFLEKIQDHLVQRQIDGEDKEDWLAQLIAAAFSGGQCKTFAGYLLGVSDHPKGKLYEIAEAMLTPYADDGLKAEAEDALL